MNLLTGLGPRDNFVEDRQLDSVMQLDMILVMEDRLSEVLERVLEVLQAFERLQVAEGRADLEVKNKWVSSEMF